MICNFDKYAQEINSNITDIFRDIHMNPELSLKEYRTTELIKKILTKLDIEIIDMGLETGVVGLLKGGMDGPVIALRADIDALPIQELSEYQYKSKIDGIMHACGHDTHTVSLIGAAMILAKFKEEIQGTVKFIFQPAEELNLGAKMLCERNVMLNPKVDAIFGLHNHFDIPVGKVGVKRGGLMAAVDTIRITVNGVGGHGAVPNRAKDPILGACAIVNALQSIVSRNVDPLESCVISFGTIHAGTANNVIPEEVKLTGTVRSFDKELGKNLKGMIERVITNTAAAYDVEAHLEYIYDLPAIFNEDDIYKIAMQSADQVCGNEGIIDPIPSMGGEDFSIYAKQAPGFLYWLGVRNEENNCVWQWHNPKFKADEGCLIVGAKIYAASVFNAMKIY